MSINDQWRSSGRVYFGCEWVMGWSIEGRCVKQYGLRITKGRGGGRNGKKGRWCQKTNEVTLAPLPPPSPFVVKRALPKSNDCS
jgi:hypothetical protein